MVLLKLAKTNYHVNTLVRELVVYAHWEEHTYSKEYAARRLRETRIALRSCVLTLYSARIISDTEADEACAEVWNLYNRLDKKYYREVEKCS